MENKVNYGIDAPEIIRNRIIGGIILGIIAIGVSIYFKDSIYPLRVFLVSIFSILAVIFIISAFLMILSSKFGKIKEAKRVIKMLDIKGDEHVLDIGCGRGLYLVEIAKELSVGKVVGIDIWSKDLSKNTKKATITNAKLENVSEKVKVKTADMTKIPFDDETFDLIISSFAINNVLDENKRKDTLVDMFRILKRCGKVCIIDIRNISDYVEVLNECGLKDTKIIRTKYLYPRSKIIIGNKK